MNNLPVDIENSYKEVFSYLKYNNETLLNSFIKFVNYFINQNQETIRTLKKVNKILDEKGYKNG